MTKPVSISQEIKTSAPFFIPENAKTIAGIAAVGLSWAYFQPESLIGRVALPVVSYFATHFLLCGIDGYLYYRENKNQVASLFSQAKFGKEISLNHAIFKLSEIERKTIYALFLEILQKWVGTEFPEAPSIATELTALWIKNRGKGACYGLAVSLMASLMHSGSNPKDALMAFTQNQPGHILFQLLQTVHRGAHAAEIALIMPDKLIKKVTDIYNDREKDPILRKLLAADYLTMVLNLHNAVESMKSAKFEDFFLKIYNINVIKNTESINYELAKEGILDILERNEEKHCILSLSAKADFHHAVYYYASPRNGAYIFFDSNIGFLLCETREQLVELSTKILKKYYLFFKDLRIYAVQSFSRAE